MPVIDAVRPLAPPAAAPRATPKPMRIAFLSYRSDPKVGGQGVYLTQAAAALARRGHKVDILSGPPYPRLPEGVRLVQIPSLDLYAQPHNGQRALRWRHLRSWADTSEYFGHVSGKFMEPATFGRRAARYLRDHVRDYDVVLDNQSLCDGLLEIESAGLPVVGVIHHPIRRDLEFALAAEPRWGMRLLARRWYGFLAMQERVAPRLRQVITVSQASAKDVSRYLSVQAARIATVPIGIDGDLFKPQPGVARLPARLVTTASADVPLKGLKYLIEAFAGLIETRPTLELVVVGRARKGPTLDLLEALNLSDRVRFVHDLSGEALAALYASATICVTPSLYEGFGLPAAEAMGCGAPVVVTDGGALPEVVGEAGVVAAKGDAAALMAAIGALLDDPVRRRDMGAAGIARAQRHFSWDRVAERYDGILRQAIASC